jgi:nitroreductase
MTTPLLDVLNNRHSIRNYDPTYVVPKEQIQKILEAAKIAPSAFSIQDVDFLAVANREKNQEAADAQISEMEEPSKSALSSRKERFHVTNVITCDASVEIILYANERSQGSPLTPIHAGIAAMSICVAAKDFGLDTLCHIAMVGPAAERVYGLPKGSAILAVALGKALPDAFMAPRVDLAKITIVE